MKYVILRVVCKFSDGSLRTINYDENHVTEENARSLNKKIIAISK